MACAGCGSGGWSQLDYQFGQEDGSATLSLGDTTLLFEGIPVSGPDVNTKMKGSITVSGSGTSEGESSVGDVTFKHSYSNGVNQLSMGDYNFKLTENGKTLVVGEQSFPLTEQTLRIGADGKALRE